MNQKVEYFCPDIFSIPVRRPAPKLQQYRVVWPCGSTWEFDRTDLDIPEFEKGDQNGVTRVYTSLREAIADLSTVATVTRIS